MEAQLAGEGALVHVQRRGAEVTIHHSKTLICECEHGLVRRPLQILLQSSNDQCHLELKKVLYQEQIKNHEIEAQP